jgi:hypothetical protein
MSHYRRSALVMLGVLFNAFGLNWQKLTLFLAPVSFDLPQVRLYSNSHFRQSALVILGVLFNAFGLNWQKLTLFAAKLAPIDLIQNNHNLPLLAAVGPDWP